MLKILMIRHGKTEGNSLGKYIGVTEETLLETEKEYLKNMNFPNVQGVYSSPRKRCLETAQLLFPNKEAIVIPELSQCNFGRLEGKTYQELKQNPEFKNWVVSSEIIAFPDGESRAEFQKRSIEGFFKVISDACSKHMDNIAMVVHNGTIMSILDAFGFPSQGYTAWGLEPAEGYRVRISQDAFLKDEDNIREMIVDRKIIRDDK